MIHFIYLGNLLIEKGPYELLTACRLLHQRGVDFHCHLVGAPTAEISFKDIEQRIAAHGLQQVVTLHGARYGAEKDKLLQLADAMVFPSYYHNECFPLVLVEGMQHSLALISTTEGAIPDIIPDDNSIGVLVNKQDAAALADAMQRLADDPETTRQMGVAAYKHYLEHYTERAFINRLASILREA